MGTLTADQAAHRMGVKVETIYAYVSRGLLERHPAPDGRTSLFDERAVESLSRRGRPRRSSRATSLDLLIETRLTSLSAQGVRYRGLPSDHLARTHTFEQVAELLWTGQLGDHRTWRGVPVAPVSGPARPAHLRTITAELLTAEDADRSIDPAPHPLDGAAVAADGRRLIATVVDALPVLGSGRTPRLVLPGGGPARTGTVAGRLWTRLSPRRPSSAMLGVLNAALVLLADHELAASTLGVRVAASTRAHPYATVLAGLGVLQGPLHGGAGRQARAVVDDALRVGPARAVGNLLDTRRPVPGFGHRVYPAADPRATVLIELLATSPEARRVSAVTSDLSLEVARRLGLHPNVDLALAALTAAAGMRADATEVLMAVPRIAGWLAHAIEEYQEPPLRFRPRARYVGD